MLLILAWVPVFTSAVLLGVVWAVVGLGSRRGLGLVVWFLGAVWLQFFTRTLALSTTGLVLQAALAIGLLLWLKREA